MLTLFLVAAILAVWLLRRGRNLETRQRIAGWTAVAAGFAIGVAVAPPLLVLRKLVGIALMPATLVWFAMIVLVARSWREPRWRRPLVAVFAAYTVAGCPWTSYLLLRGLERPFEHLRPLDAALPAASALPATTMRAAYDAVLVMGGGSSSLPHDDSGRPQLGMSGDRIRLAAALHAQGRAPILVTSGSSVDGERDISAETFLLWRGMGVPAAAIVRVPGPRNSVQEVKAYARLVEERDWRRVGLVTSARHLPRALAICRRNGLDVDPLPADFRTEKPPRSLLSLVPNGEGFADVEKAVWEYVGLLAVRLIGG